MGPGFDRRFCTLAGERSLEVSTRSRKTFQQLVTLPDSAIPLAEAALILACEEYPQTETSPYLDMLDNIAGIAQQRFDPADSPVERVGKINTVLCETFGFRGATEDYYDPRNSFFNDVLDRRVGIPITLSAVYMEVSRRLNFPIAGVGMPGHFIVKYWDRRGEIFFYPLKHGENLSRDEFPAPPFLRYGGSLHFDVRLFCRVTHPQIFSR